MVQPTDKGTHRISELIIAVLEIQETRRKYDERLAEIKP